MSFQVTLISHRCYKKTRGCSEAANI